MKLSALALSALLLLPAHAALAQHGDVHIEINDETDDSPARPGPRRSLGEARFAMTTTDDVASLLLTRDVVALQLTDRTLRQIRDGDEDEDREDGILAQMISSVVRSSVHTVLRRSIEIPIADLRSVEYRGGRLTLTTEDGERVFEEVEINDTDVMESFSPRDAQAFVREFRALKARTR